MKLTDEKYDLTTAKVEEQDKLLTTLKDQIELKQTGVNATLKIVEEERKINLIEEEKNRKYMKANAALKAKLEFIESKYDYTSSAKALDLQDFKDLISSNTGVNDTLGGFTGQLDAIQKEIQSIEAR
ncbi:hypothetical protein [Enterococcus rotai]|uniref:hypothetical protein n=1 Tax=Enterococcus rotai TaxID=118060 RepID=UPI0035C6DFFF